MIFGRKGCDWELNSLFNAEDCRIGRGAIRFGGLEKNDPFHRLYPWFGRDEKDTFGVALGDENTVQADVVDIDTMRRVDGSLFVATVDAALVAGSFDFDPRGRRCAGDDFDNGHSSGDHLLVGIRR